MMMRIFTSEKLNLILMTVQWTAQDHVKIHVLLMQYTKKPGVITERCYGCGRCFPVCPFDKIKAISYVRDAAATSKLLERDDVDALEIHTNGRQTESFKELWNGLGNSVNQLKLVAVSLPYVGDSTVSMMNKLYAILERNLCCLNLWQLDGRPMSGDIGRGTTRESIAFAHRLVFADDRPPGFLQLAGGTNAHTVDGLRKLNLFQMPSVFESSRANALIGGIAYGGYARKIVKGVMESESRVGDIEAYPDHLFMALIQALTLVGGVKAYKLDTL
ncbi:hypothetical protein R6Q59_023622 [Mikania micrantha]